MEFAAAIIGLTDVAVRAGSKASELTRRWKDAPREVHQLRDDISRAENFFQVICQQLGVTQDRWTLGAQSELPPLLRRGSDILKELERILHQILTPRLGPQLSSEGPVEDLKKRRKFIWLAKCQKVQQLRKALAASVFSIMNHVVLFNITISAETQDLIKASRHEIILQTEDRLQKSADQLMRDSRAMIQASQNLTFIKIDDTVASLMDTLTANLDTRLLRIQESVKSDVDLALSTSRAEASSALDERQKLQNEGFQRVIEGFEDQLLELRQGVLADISCKMSEIASQLSPNTEQRFRMQEQRLQALERIVERSHARPWSAACVDRLTNLAKKVAPSPTCQRNCPCRCHVPRSYGRWRLAFSRTGAGSISVSWMGLSTQGQCDHFKCSGTALQLVHLQLIFPAWLTRAIFSIIFTPRISSPEPLLRVSHRVSMDYDIFSQSIFAPILNGDLAGVQKVLQARSSSILDIYGTRCFSALLYAVDLRQADIAQFLLRAGADPSIENSAGQSCLSVALDWYIIGTTEGLEYMEMLSLSEVLEQQDFSQLHKVVLEILPLDITKALSQDPFSSQVNLPNRYGYTPLHLAAMRGDLRTAVALLDAGADIHAATSSKDTPLHLACFGNATSIVEQLLRAGADVNAADHQGETPIFRARMPEILALLQQYGSDIDAENNTGFNCLWKALWLGLDDLVESLINHGAKMNNPYSEGHYPLIVSIGWNKPQCAKVLLDQGANYRVADVNEGTVLHWLAWWGNVEMLNIFTDAAMSGLDLTKRDNYGDTAEELFYMRSDLSEELEEAFEMLLESVEKANRAVSLESCTDSLTSDEDCYNEETDTEEYFDAVEHWTVESNSEQE